MEKTIGNDVTVDVIIEFINNKVERLSDSDFKQVLESVIGDLNSQLEALDDDEDYTLALLGDPE